MRDADEGEEMNNYDQLLCDYLAKRYSLCWKTLLDVGCGEGNHVKAFQKWHVFTTGIDRPQCNLENQSIPYPDNYFHIVFSKSVIEHIRSTDHLLSEMRRVLRTQGIVICLTPDWRTDYKMFYDDPTHIRPFTKKGLEKAFTLAGFKDVQCEEFYQLPFLWKHPWLKFIPHLIALLPDSWKYHNGKQNVLIRHSKERMLLLTARKA